jgi:hypothetical protein
VANHTTLRWRRTADRHGSRGCQAGQTISVILQGTDDGEFPLTRYDRVIIRVR